MALILPRLYLGSAIEHAYDEEFLTQNKITHVLNCGVELPKNKYPISVIVNSVDMEDMNDDSCKYIFKGADIIYDILRTPESVLLIHCWAGKSRSVSVVLAYLVKYKQYTPEKGLRYIREKRDCITPYGGFLQYIKEMYYKDSKSCIIN